MAFAGEGFDRASKDHTNIRIIPSGSRPKTGGIPETTVYRSKFMRSLGLAFEDLRVDVLRLTFWSALVECGFRNKDRGGGSYQV